MKKGYLLYILLFFCASTYGQDAVFSQYYAAPIKTNPAFTGLTHNPLINFKNYETAYFEFNPKINCFLGKNSVGKTNVLDAIYYLSFSRSYFSRTDAQNVQHGMQGMRIAGSYSLENETYTVQCILRENNKKEWYLSNFFFLHFLL